MGITCSGFLEDVAMNVTSSCDKSRRQDLNASHEIVAEHYDVLVFDSGVGGLSIAREIRLLMPQASLMFVGDTQALPYGLKDERWLKHRLAFILSKVLQKIKVKVVVIACNTASTLALDHLRHCFDIPIVGVVPAIKPAALMSKTKKIGLLATPATISRPYTKNLIKQFASECEVIAVGSSRLVELSELYVRGQVSCWDELAEIVIEFGHRRESFVDVVVLGCTHFPLIKDQLIHMLPEHIIWLDSSCAIARRVFEVLNKFLKENRIEGLEGRQSNDFSSATFTHHARDSALIPFLESLGIVRLIDWSYFQV